MCLLLLQQLHLLALLALGGEIREQVLRRSQFIDGLLALELVDVQAPLLVYIADVVIELVHTHVFIEESLPFFRWLQWPINASGR